jgi:hypothetical protein
MDKVKRSGRERTADFRARLTASREPPAYVVAKALTASLLEAMLAGDVALAPSVIVERAGASVVGPQYSQEGFDNVLSRLAQPVSRKPG